MRRHRDAEAGSARAEKAAASWPLPVAQVVDEDLADSVDAPTLGHEPLRNDFARC